MFAHKNLVAHIRILVPVIAALMASSKDPAEHGAGKKESTVSD